MKFVCVNRWGLCVHTYLMCITMYMRVINADMFTRLYVCTHTGITPNLAVLSFEANIFTATYFHIDARFHIDV